MKIALIGAQGVGKTSLSRALMERYSQSHLVKETVRECPYPCDKDADFKTEWWVLSHSILAEQEARESGQELVITDRCLLDIAVYTKLIHESRDGRISDLQRQLIEETITSWMKEDPYDLVFYIKVKPEIWQGRDIDDGFRSVDPDWYRLISGEFEAALERFRMGQQSRLILLENNGTFASAIDSVCDAIERFKALPDAKRV